MAQRYNFSATFVSYYDDILVRRGVWLSTENHPCAEIPVCFDNCREQILRQFTRSNAKTRTAYWNTEGTFFTKFIPHYVSVNPSNQMVEYAYNAALFSKGILLTATTKSADLIIDRNNLDMVQTYNNYLSLKGNKQRTVEQDFELQALEDVIVKYQKDHKDDYRKDFRIVWKDVKDKLKQNDVAIEFVTYPDDNGIENYAALVLKKDYNVPRFIHLLSLEQINPNRSLAPACLFKIKVLCCPPKSKKSLPLIHGSHKT